MQDKDLQKYIHNNLNIRSYSLKILIDIDKLIFKKVKVKKRDSKNQTFINSKI